MHKNFLIDMDGVLVRGRSLIPGADQFIRRLRECGSKFLILTNNPIYTPRDLAFRLQSIGLEVEAENLFTSAMATGRFIEKQKKNAKVYVLGESGLTQALHEAGCVLTDLNPDYVVLGEVSHYNIDQITKAVQLIVKGALFLATNPDATGPMEEGVMPSTGALAALIEKAAGKSPFFIGKPNPLMMRSALNYLGIHSENTVMVGDRMDTDVVAGLMSGLETILVLTGVSTRDSVLQFPYRPTYIFDSVASIPLDCISGDEPHPPV